MAVLWGALAHPPPAAPSLPKETAFGGIIPANSRCLNHGTFYPAIMHDGTPVTTRRRDERTNERPTGGIIIAARAARRRRRGPLKAAPNLQRHCGTRLIGKEEWDEKRGMTRPPAFPPSPRHLKPLKRLLPYVCPSIKNVVRDGIPHSIRRR